jgi:type I restriction enzyme S subunit
MGFLEQHFDTAFSAPNGVQNLRELILTLAMQGKLVPQETRDSPASQLLKEIEVEKKQLAKAGKIRAPKPLQQITPGDASYALPTGWQWVRLGLVGNIFNGNSINASEKEAKYAGAKGLPYIATKDVGYGFDPLDYENGIRIPVSEEQFRVAHKGAVLICAEGGSAGKKCGLTDRDICFGNKLFANELYGQIPSRFILYTYLSPVFRASFSAAMTGIIGGVSIAKFVEIPIPLPPLEEQYRIVAKIDQLMARCDALESLRNEREEKRLATHAAALSQLLDATGNRSTDEAWTFITEHFADLYAVKENVIELRQAILQLAITGRLSPPKESDNQVARLVERLQIEQSANLSLRSKDRDEIQTALKAATASAVSNRVPLSARLFCEFITKGTTPAADELKEFGDIPFLKVYNIVRNKLDFDYRPSFVSYDVHQNQLKRSILRPGDVIMNIVGPPLGKVAVVTDQFPEWNMNQALAVFRPLAGILSAYIYYALSTNSVLESALREVKGTAGQDNLSLEQCRDLVIPIPSIEEQHRTVEKIDKLMELCDTLEQRIDAAKVKQTELLGVLMFDNRESRCA